MKKKSGIIAEFKEFIMRGNVINLAVGVIIGAAFQAIVNSLVNDIVMPVISIATGGIDFKNWFYALDGNTYETIEAAAEAGAATINYGNFISAIINFCIMAVVIFCIVKAINALVEKTKKEEPAEEPAAPTTKKCPYCKSEIDLEATKCPNCTSDVE